MAKKKGITVPEMRAIMADRSKLADRSKSGFAVMDKEKAREIQRKGGLAGRKNELRED